MLSPAKSISVHSPHLIRNERNPANRQLFEPVHEKTNNLGFRPGPTRTGLYRHRIKLETLDISGSGFELSVWRKQRR